MPSKKAQLQRKELLTNERSSGSILKIEYQIRRNSSSAECMSNGVVGQPIMVTKGKDILKDNNADSDMIEERVRMLPTGGESWDWKMKMKHSVSAVVSRSVDNGGELKRSMHHRLTIESSLLSSDSTHGFRPQLNAWWTQMLPLNIFFDYLEDH